MAARGRDRPSRPASSSRSTSRAGSTSRSTGWAGTTTRTASRSRVRRPGRPLGRRHVRQRPAHAPYAAGRSSTCYIAPTTRTRSGRRGRRSGRSSPTRQVRRLLRRRPGRRRPSPATFIEVPEAHRDAASDPDGSELTSRATSITRQLRRTARGRARRTAVGARPVGQCGEQLVRARTCSDFVRVEDIAYDKRHGSERRLHRRLGSRPTGEPARRAGHERPDLEVGARPETTRRRCTSLIDPRRRRRHPGHGRRSDDDPSAGQPRVDGERRPLDPGGSGSSQQFADQLERQRDDGAALARTSSGRSSRREGRPAATVDGRSDLDVDASPATGSVGVERHRRRLRGVRARVRSWSTSRRTRCGIETATGRTRPRRDGQVRLHVQARRRTAAADARIPGA